jgi:hypothetical protein
MRLPCDPRCGQAPARLLRLAHRLLGLICVYQRRHEAGVHVLVQFGMIPEQSLSPVAVRECDRPRPAAPCHRDQPAAGPQHALLTLAAEVPAAILAKTLGIHVQVAVQWQKISAGDWAAYAADVSRRTTHSLGSCPRLPECRGQSCWERASGRCRRAQAGR